MDGPPDFPALILELHGELAQHGDRWRLEAPELVRLRLESPYEFLDWAMRDTHWSFTMAELLRESSGRPENLGGRLLLAILVELREEQQTAQGLAE